MVLSADQEMADYLARGRGRGLGRFFLSISRVAAADSHRQFLFGNALAAGGILDDAIQKFREVIRFKPQSKMPTWAWCARSLRPGVRTKL